MSVLELANPDSMRYFDDGTPAINRPDRDFHVGRLLRTVEKANREPKTLFREPQPEHFGQICIGVFA